MRRRGGRIGDAVRLRAGRAFIVLRVVLIARLHADFVTDVRRLQGVALAVGASDGLAVAQPLVADFALRNAVAIADGRGECLAHLRHAADDDRAGLVWLRLRRRGGQIGDRIRLCTQRRFRMPGLVRIARLHRNFRALLRGGEQEHRAGRARNRLPVGKPLILHLRRIRQPVRIADGRGQNLVNHRLAANRHRARMIGRGRRGRRRIRHRGGRRAQRILRVLRVVRIKRAHGDDLARLGRG